MLRQVVGRITAEGQYTNKWKQKLELLRSDKFLSKSQIICQEIFV